MKKFLILLTLITSLFSCSKTTPVSPNPSVLPCDVSTNYTIPKGIYTIDCILEVSNAAVLTIEPGTILNFNQGAGIRVKAGASITAVGTAALPIVFKGSQATKGFWGGIVLRSKSIYNKFAYCQISDAGSNAIEDNRYGSNLAMIVATASVDNCTITNSSGVGIWMSGDYFADYSGRDATAFTSFTNNKIKSNTAFPIYTSAAGASNLGTGNDMTGNGNDYIAIRDQGIGADGVKPNINFTEQTIGYLFAQIDGDDGVVFNGDVVFQPGATIVMGPDISICIDAMGSLSAIGTSAKPIIIKGLQNTKGYWGNVNIKTNNTKNQLQYCQLSDGGGVNGIETKCSNTGIISTYQYTAKSRRLSVTNCQISNSLNSGIYLKLDPTGDPGVNYNPDIETSNTFSACSPNVDK